MKALKKIGKASLIIILLFVVALVVLLNTRPDLSEFENSYAGPATGKMTVRFFGTSSMMFSDGETNIMIDGWFTRPNPFDALFGKIEPDAKAIDAGFQKLGDPDIDVLIPVHTHYDHAMDVGEIMKKPSVALVGSESSKNIALGACEDVARCKEIKNIKPMKHGDHRCVGKFKITLYETEHFVNSSKVLNLLVKMDPSITEPLKPPVPLTSYGTGSVYSVLIEHPDGTALVQASANYKAGALAKLGLDVDTVYLGIGGLASKGDAYQDDYWQEVVIATKAESVYPIHWDSLTDSAFDTDKYPLAPNRLANDIFNAKAKGSLLSSFEKAERDGKSIALLPMWEAVDAFLNKKPSHTGKKLSCSIPDSTP